MSKSSLSVKNSSKSFSPVVSLSKKWQGHFFWAINSSARSRAATVNSPLREARVFTIDAHARRARVDDRFGREPMVDSGGRDRVVRPLEPSWGGSGGPFPKDVPAEKVIITKAVVVDVK